MSAGWPGQRLLKWSLTCAAGEVGGIAAAAALYALLATAVGEPHSLPVTVGAWMAAAACGAPEGLILGSVQARAIAGIYGLRVNRAAFVVRSIVAAVAGWAVGTFFPLFMPAGAPEAGPGAVEPPLAATMAFAALIGAMAGVLFGALQARALAGRRLRRAWLIANVAGWAAGLPAIYLFAQIGADLPGWAPTLASWAAGGAIAGLAIGVTTGIALSRAAAPPNVTTSA